VRILLRRVSDDQHELTIDRGDPAARESVVCETRSYLSHDLLHFAVETEAKLSRGLWGNLAAGRTLAELNDRAGGMGAGTVDPAEMGAIEQVVGPLSGTLKGRSPSDLVEGMNQAAASLGTTMPVWLTVPFVEAVQERMRRLLGRWRATPFGETMALHWPGNDWQASDSVDESDPR
jgi:hypothetical protein